MRGIKLGVILLLMLGLLLGPAAASAMGGKNIVKIGTDVKIEAGQKVRTARTLGPLALA